MKIFAIQTTGVRENTGPPPPTYDNPSHEEPPALSSLKFTPRTLAPASRAGSAGGGREAQRRPPAVHS
jgi:hypothetical protein